MNQGRIWCVVNPTVGLPLLLGSVTAIALIVHGAVLSHSTWFGNYWQGAAKTRTSDNGANPALASVPGAPGFSVTVSPVASAGKAETSFVVTVAPSATVDQAAAEAVSSPHTSTLAMAGPSSQ